MGFMDAIIVGATLFVFVITQVWFHWDLSEATAATLSANHAPCRANASHDGQLVYVHGCEVLVQPPLLAAAGLGAFAPFFRESAGSRLEWEVYTWETHVVNHTRCTTSEPIHCEQVPVDKGYWVRNSTHGTAPGHPSDFLVGSSGEEASAYGLNATLAGQLAEPVSGFLQQPPADAHFPTPSADGPPLDAAAAFVDGDNLVSYNFSSSQPNYGDIRVKVQLYQLPRAPSQVTVVARQARLPDGSVVLEPTDNVGWAAAGDVSLDDVADDHGLSWASEKCFLLAATIEVLIVLMFTAHMIQNHPCRADVWVFLIAISMLSFVNGVAWLPFDLKSGEYWAGGGIVTALLGFGIKYFAERRRASKEAASRASKSIVQVYAREPLLAADPPQPGFGLCDEPTV